MFGHRMPFGKHAGWLLEDVPSSYLAWALRTCDNLDDWLREAIEEELECRAPPRRRNPRPGPPPGPPPPPPPPPAVLAGVIDRWHRRLVMLHHPDRGGSTEVMQAINAAVDELRQMIGVG
jgi:hypothetical protein